MLAQKKNMTYVNQLTKQTIQFKINPECLLQNNYNVYLNEDQFIKLASVLFYNVYINELK